MKRTKKNAIRDAQATLTTTRTGGFERTAIQVPAGGGGPSIDIVHPELGILARVNISFMPETASASGQPWFNVDVIDIGDEELEAVEWKTRRALGFGLGEDGFGREVYDTGTVTAVEFTGVK